MFNLNKLLIHIFLLTTMLSIYMPIKKYALYALVFLHVYFTLLLLVKLKQYNNKFNVYIFILVVLLIVSIFISQIFTIYPFLNIVTILSIYYLVRFKYFYLLPLLSKYIIVFSFINFLMYISLPPDYIGMKEVGDYLIQRIQLNIIPLSIASILALLSIVMSESIKNNLLKYFIVLTNLYLIFLLGKLSVMITLISVLVIVYVLKYLYMMNEIIANSFIKILFFIFYFLFLIIIFGKDYLPEEYIRLLTMRDEIYSSFFTYVIENSSVLLGSGFINNYVFVNELTTQPHNQVLHIFFIFGIIGLILFFIIFYKVLSNTQAILKKGNSTPIKIILSIYILMSMDSYFILSVFPIYMIYIMFYLIQSSKYISRMK